MKQSNQFSFLKEDGQTFYSIEISAIFFDHSSFYDGMKKKLKC